ncbi:AAA family ATPase [Methylobacter sp. Wu1]|jgi:type II secretory pathway predicted ATPase ExeA|uniref:ExeA family protein n=1 Tax=unclassified Methylobacter TaxID=2635283 RepID=UPI00227A905B|nr:AAA family ATPase [Methylobacter sp. YRD-M1]WAK04250.1 AAA family ATPase [Methylobacter sp. YRD-M1]
MLSDVMDYYGLAQDCQGAGYFETEHHQQIAKELKAQVKQGRMIALSGIVGCGKTTTLKAIRQELIKEKEVLVSKSLSIEKGRVNLGTLMMALFYDLATEKDFKIPTQPEKRERMLQTLIRKRQKPIALFVDEAHDLDSKTLIGLKRLIEVVQDGEGTLSIVLAGHPKLKNELRRPVMEEIGSRTTIFSLEGIQGQKIAYINWLLEKCLKKGVKRSDVFTDEALAQLAERLTTPLQIEQHLRLAFEEAYRIGQKPVETDIIEAILAKDINALGPRLTRHGYNAKALAELLDTKPAEIRSFLQGNLTPARTQELQNSLLAIGIPL